MGRLPPLSARQEHHPRPEVGSEASQSPTPRRGPRIWLILALVVLVALPLPLLAGFADDMAANAMRTQVNARVQDNAAVATTFLQDKLGSIETLAISYANDPGVAAALGGGAPSASTTQALTQRLRALNLRQPGITLSLAVTPQGTIRALYPTDPRVVGRNARFHTWFGGVSKTGAPYVSPTFQTGALNHPEIIAVAVPVRAPKSQGGAGPVVGYLVVGYSPTPIQEFVDRAAAGHIGLTVTDQRGVVVAAPASGPRRFVSLAHNPQVAAALAGRSGTAHLGSVNNGAVEAFSSIPGLGWAVVARVSTRYAYAPTRTVTDAIRLAALFFEAVLIGGVVLALRARRREVAAMVEVERNNSHTAAILEATTDAFVGIDAQGRITSWNRQAERIFLIPRDQALGADMAEAIIPERLRQAHLDGVARYLSGQPSTGHRSETIATDAEGREFPIELVVWSTGGDLYSFIRDISERKAAEARLTAERSFLRALLDSLQEGILACDAEGNITVFNPTVTRLHGQMPDASLAAITQRQHLFDPTGLRPLGEREIPLRRALAGETLIDTEVALRGADGVLRMLVVNGQPISDGEGNQIGAVIAIRDVTQEKVAIAGLAASEERFRLLASAVPTGVFHTNPDGHLLYANDHWVELAGLGGEQILGRYWVAIVHPRDQQRVLGAWAAAQQTGEAFHDKFRSGADLSSPHWIEVLLSPQRDASGSITGFVGAVNDITVMVEAEQALLDARDQAVEASRLKSHFLANMSHEIRTPMNGVLGMAELLEGDNFTPEQRRYLDALRASGQSLLAIINDILDFSKVEAGRLEIEVISFDLRATVEEALSALALSARSKGLDFELAIDQGIDRWVRGDPTRVVQVLTNLAGNAVKFTDEGKVTVSVGRRGGNAVRFTVTDTGIGISPHDRQRLLHPFSQADASTTRRFGGTGLGLAISRELIGLMGGELHLEGRPGLGTTFWFELTMAPAAPPDEDLPLTDPPALDGTDYDHALVPKGTRVLLVEDGEINRLVATAILERMGCTVEVAVNGLEAVNAVREATPYDVIVMDCLMPTMDGFEATRQIRRLEGERQHTPIVALTASAMRGDREKCLAVGMTDYVTKPLDPKVLASAISRSLGVNLSSMESRADRQGDASIPDEVRPKLSALEEAIGRDALRHVCEVFMAELPDQLAELRSGLAADDIDRARAAAHALKGSVSHLGAQRLVHLAEAVSEALRVGAPVHDSVLADLQAEAKAVLDALESVAAPAR